MLNMTKAFSIMQPNEQFDAEAPQADWQALQIYSIYRVFIACLLPLLAFYERDVWLAGEALGGLFMSLTICYFTYALVCLYFNRFRLINYVTLLTLVISTDIIFLTLFVFAAGGVGSGLGILVNIAQAVGCILLPGFSAIGFATLATLALLSAQSVAVFNDWASSIEFFTVGLHGIACFATALTAQFLARRIQHSEALVSQSRKDLRRLTCLNAHIIERLHTGIVIINKDWHVELMNIAAEKILHLDHAKPQRHIADVSSELAQRINQWQMNPLGKLSALQLTKEQGEWMVSIEKLDDSDEQLLIILDDMARMSQHAQQLKLASLGRFTASLAHELRNPLGAISHALQLLNEGQDFCDEDVKLMRIMSGQTERMNAVIKNILQLSRRETVRPVSVNLKAWLEGFIQEFKQSSPLEFQYKIENSCHDDTVLVDKSQLQQVMTVLAENCIKHADKTQQNICITFSIGYIEATNQVTLDIQDNGPGMKAEDAQKCFEPFFTTTRQGTGLGLYIARELCEINHANLSYIGQVGEGAKFRIQFFSHGHKLQ